MSLDGKIEFSAEEKAAFNEFKKRIINDAGQEIVDDYLLYRFLKARDFNVKQAETMLKKNLEWRKRNKVDSILQDYVLSELFEKYFAFNMIGFDRDDSAIIVTSMGKTDQRGLYKSTTKEDILKHTVYCMELWEQKMKERSNELGGKLVETYTMIMDFEKFSLAQASSKIDIETKLEVCLLYDANYPERMKRIYIINASVYFYFLFRIIKPFISANTIQKVRIFGKDGWKEELLKIIDPKVLPAYLGGERTDPDGNVMCHTIMNHGGPIPERLYVKNSKRLLKNQSDVKLHVLKRRSKFDLVFHVEIAGSFIEWDIETDDHDIAFGLFYKDRDNNLIPLIPVQRVDSHLLCETGTFLCENNGTYIFRLDNSYSILRAKHIYYRATVVKPQERII